MDRCLAAQLKDKTFGEKLVKLVAGYVTTGFRSVDYWSPEWDAAHDVIMCYAPLPKKDHETLAKDHPKRFVLPMTATQISTMTTYIAQVLFGEASPHRVEPRGPQNDVSAEHINTLLKWNAEQQPTFLLGHLMVQDALVYNRGIMYNSWTPIFRPEAYVVEVVVPESFTEDGEPEKYSTNRFRNKKIGGYAKSELVSPYDWICDPAMPLWRAQEGRFMGHRFKTSWVELKRRSELPIDDPAYVRPEAVELLKSKKKQDAGGIPGMGGVAGSGSTTNNDMSRSLYERQQLNGPGPGAGVGAVTADAKDPGIVTCTELWVRLIPKEYGIHDGTDPTLYQFIVANTDVLLAVNESSYAHGQFPYSYAEGRPSGHQQFSPSWSWMIKGLQDHVDYLKNRHQEALQRTVGNVFVANPYYVDVEDFLNPEKEGLVIQLKPTAAGQKISDIIHQIPIKDLTEHFPQEMEAFVSYAESVTGANNNMQGVAETGGTATEFAGTQSMAAGRMSSIARLISVQALVPQTKQIVGMFQQFLEDTQAVRYVADPFTSPSQLKSMRVLEVSRDTIQGEFDFIAHDGSLPNGDSKQVAAIARILQVAAGFPQIFAPGPGNLDPRQLVLAGAKASGLKDIERFFYDTPGAQSAVAAQVNGAMPGMAPTGVTSPGGAPPGPAPAMPSLPPVEPPGIAPLAPSQPHPGNL